MQQNGGTKAGLRTLSFIPVRAAVVLCLPLIVCSSCAFFSRQPALPRNAAIDSGDEDKFSLLVESADIIYFPSELVGLPRASEASWKLVEALQRRRRFALGWDLFAGDEQSILDQWSDRQLPAETIARLHLHGGPRESETYRVFLREASKRGAHFMALRSENETTSLREEFAAERVAGYFREHRGEKLLVFLHRRHLGNKRGVPFLVAQKIRARQLVLDSREHPPESSRLLAGGWSWLRQTRIVRRFQIVNSSPAAGSDQL
ncbi:MAG: hypothetical protein V7609_2065 [Verrucomicrobiota bacterium]